MLFHFQIEYIATDNNVDMLIIPMLVLPRETELFFTGLELPESSTGLDNPFPTISPVVLLLIPLLLKFSVPPTLKKCALKGTPKLYWSIKLFKLKLFRVVVDIVFVENEFGWLNRSSKYLCGFGDDEGGDGER